MNTTSSSLTCPACGHENSNLVTRCSQCQARLEEYRLLQQRVADLENRGGQHLAGKEFLDAFQCYAILLEYKPGAVAYWKGWCSACIGLGAKDKAGLALNHLRQRLAGGDAGVEALEAAFAGLS